MIWQLIRQPGSCQSVSMSAYISVRLSIRPFDPSSVYLSACISVCVSVCLSIGPSVRLEVSMSVSLSVRLFVCLSACHSPPPCYI